MNKLMFGPKRSSIDFNSVFVALNYFLFCATVLFYWFFDFPRLVNGTTLIIYAFLLIQVQLFLYYERRHRNPFVLVLVYVMTFFYFPRIITLYWIDLYYSSGVLDRLRPATVDHINYTLIFVFVANVAIFLALFVAEKQVKPQIAPLPEKQAKYVYKWLWIFALAILYGLYTSVFNPLDLGDERRGLRYLGVFLDNRFLVPIAIIYLYQLSSGGLGAGRLTLRKSSLYKVAIVMLIVVQVLLITLYGSRSGGLSLIQSVFFVLLAVEVYRIRKKGVAAMALLIIIFIPMFTVATLSRSIRASHGTEISLLAQKEMLVENVSTSFRDVDLARLLSPVFDRVAYLDFSADLMKNRSEYQQVVNIPFYFMSVVDNVTPGFDVFDVPKAANALSYIYTEQPKIGPRVGDYYQSDQFNVYGEYYTLLGGWASVPAFFGAAFILQSLFLRIKARRSFSTIMWRYFTIVLFFNWLISFGTDWQIVSASRDVIVLFLLILIFDRKWVLSSSTHKQTLSQAIAQQGKG